MQTLPAQQPTFKQLEHYPLLAWLVLHGLVIFGFCVAWEEDLIGILVRGDQSRISLGIAFVFLVGTAHCARRVVFIANEIDLAARAHALVAERSDGPALRVRGGALYAADGTSLPDCTATRFCTDMIKRQHDGTRNGDRPRAEEALAEQVKGSHEIGWFMVDILVKLGLIGTIVGFIFMLGSVADSAELDVNTMQKVLRQMSAGMGTALFTTLAGLIGSIILGMQYLLLDKSADDLILRTLALAELGAPGAATAEG